MWPPLSQAWPYHPLRRLPSSMTRQAHIRLNNELAAFRDAASIGSSDDDHMDTNELGDGYRARRTRIRRIAALLAEAIVDDDSAGDGTAEPGAPVVTVHYDDTGDTATFVLGGRGAGDADNNIYPLRSPIGRAVAGARPGQRRTSTLPADLPIAVTLLKVQPAAAHSCSTKAGPPGSSSSPPIAPGCSSGQSAR